MVAGHAAVRSGRADRGGGHEHRLVALPLAVLGAGFLAVAFYLRRIPGTAVSATEGARLGALSGLLCFGMWAVLEALAVAVLHKGPEIRKAMLDAVEQQAARYSDPQFQASMEFMRSPAGLTVMMIGSLIVAFLACVILASIGGALAGRFSGAAAALKFLNRAIPEPRRERAPRPNSALAAAPLAAYDAAFIFLPFTR